MRVYFLNLPIDCLPMNDFIDFLVKRMNAGKRTRIVTLNPEMVVSARSSPTLRKAICGADLVVPDGIGIVLSLRSLGYQTGRIPGIDLAYHLMACLSHIEGKVYLLGGDPGVAQSAAERLKPELPGLRIVGVADGFFSSQEEAAVIERVISAQPDLLIVGMGTPRQEIWLERHWGDLNVPIGIGVGGSFDIWAGRIRRAPTALQRFGLEWLYRVWVQPGRWRRLPRLIQFMIVAVLSLRRKRVSEDEK